MAGVRVGERTRPGVEHSVEHGDEHGRLVLRVQQGVGLGQGLRGGFHPDGDALQQGPADHHEQCGRDPLPRHVGDHDAEPAVLQAIDVVEIAAYLLGRDHAAVDLELRRARKRRRQDGQLHGVRDVELLAQGLELVLGRQRLAHDPGVPEGLVDRGLEVVEVDRLGHEVERAPVHRDADVVHVAVGGDHHRPDLGIHLAERIEEGKAVEPRHVDVGEDHLELGVLREPLQGLEPVLGEGELELAAPDAATELLADEDLEIGLVVDDEDLRRPSVHLVRGDPVRVRHGKPSDFGYGESTRKMAPAATCGPPRGRGCRAEPGRRRVGDASPGPGPAGLPAGGPDAAPNQRFPVTISASLSLPRASTARNRSGPSPR